MRPASGRTYVFLLVVLSLITAGISPACQFISGQSDLIEICSVDGLKKIALPRQDSLPTQDGEHKTSTDKCPFCFSAHVAKVIAAQNVTADTPVITRSTPVEIYGPAVIAFRPVFYDPTGPPSLS